MRIDVIIDGKNWNQWLFDHIKVCTQCRDAFEEMGDNGMCQAAFDKMHAYAIAAQDHKEEPMEKVVLAPVVENMTVYQIIQLADDHFDEVWAILNEMAKEHPETTLAKATVEWAHRHGREIVIVPTKSVQSHHAISSVNIYS